MLLSKMIEVASHAALWLACVVSPAAFGQQSVTRNASESPKFELATVVRNLMYDKTAKGGFRGDYLYFKSLLTNLHSLTDRERLTPSWESFPDRPGDYGKIFAGKMPLLVRGRQLLAENMEDQYLWTVYVAGPNAGVSNMFIRSDMTVVQPAGQTYFTESGLTLDLITCDKHDSQNYSAYYRVSAPTKHALVLGISKSTGSGGIWYSYEIAWDGIKTDRLGKDAVIGLCNIDD